MTDSAPGAIAGAVHDVTSDTSPGTSKSTFSSWDQLKANTLESFKTEDRVQPDNNLQRTVTTIEPASFEPKIKEPTVIKPAVEPVIIEPVVTEPVSIKQVSVVQPEKSINAGRRRKIFVTRERVNLAGRIIPYYIIINFDLENFKKYIEYAGYPRSEDAMKNIDFSARTSSMYKNHPRGFNVEAFKAHPVTMQLSGSVVVVPINNGETEEIEITGERASIFAVSFTSTGVVFGNQIFINEGIANNAYTIETKYNWQTGNDLLIRDGGPSEIQSPRKKLISPRILLWSFLSMLVSLPIAGEWNADIGAGIALVSVLAFIISLICLPFEIAKKRKRK